MNSNQPSYIALFNSGELKERADRLEAKLSKCDICPRKCAADRLNNRTGFCQSGYLPVISSYCCHNGEEPAISGIKGSGTIFFGNCNLKCVFCQNYQISQNWKEQSRNTVSFGRLADIMLYLQDELGCHNINLVSPSHFVPQILKALLIAIPRGLHVPLVYNTNSYDSRETLIELRGIIDIYLPDLKYSSDRMARKYSSCRHYVENARAAVREMYSQAGNLVTDEAGVAVKGVIVRHLILPNDIAGSKQSLEWLANEVSSEIAISLMSQYSPQNKAGKVPLLARKIYMSEYKSVVNIMEQLGMENGWIQGMESADDYLPDFINKSHPFNL